MSEPKHYTAFADIPRGAVRSYATMCTSCEKRAVIFWDIREGSLFERQKPGICSVCHKKEKEVLGE